MTTTSALSEIRFIAEVVEDHGYNATVLAPFFHSQAINATYLTATSLPNLLLGASSALPNNNNNNDEMITAALSPSIQTGLHCLNLIQRPATLAIHRNIAAWVAVTLASIGIFGNIFSLFVLFRTQPRSPTDVYMMHLAAYDVAYEIFFAIVIASRTWWVVRHRASFSFVLISLLCRPLIDLFSNLATVVVTVFAMERLLAVYRPLKILNTSANKLVLWIALGTATAITLPDFFEFGVTNLDVTTSVYSTASPTTISVSLVADNSTAYFAIPFSTLSGLPGLLRNGTEPTAATQYDNGAASPAEVYEVTETVLYDDEVVVTAASNGFVSPSLSPVLQFANGTHFNNNNYYQQTGASSDSVYCYYRTEFAQSQFYNAYVYFYTVMFTFIPLFLLIFANGFLIWGVARASKNRKSLTTGQHCGVGLATSSAALGKAATCNNNSNISRGMVSMTNGDGPSIPLQGRPSVGARSVKSHQADQQRLTLMLVMIVLIFTVCQLPIAILAIYSLLNEQMMGNIAVLVIYSNILVIVFSTTNFAFYSAFSRRFRHTLKEMIDRLKQTIRKKSRQYYRGDSAGGNNKNNNNNNTNRMPGGIILRSFTSIRRHFLPPSPSAKTRSDNNLASNNNHLLPDEKKPMLLPASVVETVGNLNNNSNQQQQLADAETTTTRPAIIIGDNNNEPTISATSRISNDIGYKTAFELEEKNSNNNHYIITNDNENVPVTFV